MSACDMCAKLSRVSLTWEDSGGFREGESWASHLKNTMTHLWRWQTGSTQSQDKYQQAAWQWSKPTTMKSTNARTHTRKLLWPVGTEDEFYQPSATTLEVPMSKSTWAPINMEKALARVLTRKSRRTQAGMSREPSAFRRLNRSGQHPGGTADAPRTQHQNHKTISRLLIM